MREDDKLHHDDLKNKEIVVFAEIRGDILAREKHWHTFCTDI